MQQPMRHPILAALLLTAALTACSGGRQVGNEEYGTDNARERILRGGGVNPTNAGLVVFGVDRNQQTEQGGPGGVSVNAYLWRATLETLSFMPLASADPYGGVVTTDWYANPDKPNERFKATVYILDSRLRADGIKVALFKEQLGAAGWTTAPTDPDTAIQLENAILTKARQFKLATVGG
jgi:hypothetical protein